MDYLEMEKMMEELMRDPQYQQLFGITFAVVFGIFAVIGLATYILGAIGVRDLSTSAGLSRPWMAFVPVLRWAQFGRLAEMRLPRELPKRKVFRYSIHLPVLMVLSTVLESIYVGYSLYYTYLQPDAVIPEQLSALFGGISAAYTVINTIVIIVLLMAIHRVMILVRSSSPMLMTLLCALISSLMPILLFAYRKNKIAKPLQQEQDPSDHDNGFYYDGQ